MNEGEILKELFDEKVIKIISIFLEQPEREFYLSEASNVSKVNLSSTFRVLNRLVYLGFIKAKLVGKIKLYSLEKNSKTLALSRILSKRSDPLEDFVEKIKSSPKAKKVILESRIDNHAKIIIVTSETMDARIKKICEEIKNLHNFVLEFVEISESQYNGLKEFKNYNLDRKVVWQQ